MTPVTRVPRIYLQVTVRFRVLFFAAHLAHTYISSMSRVAEEGAGAGSTAVVVNGDENTHANSSRNITERNFVHHEAQQPPRRTTTLRRGEHTKIV